MASALVWALARSKEWGVGWGSTFPLVGPQGQWGWVGDT